MAYRAPILGSGSTGKEEKAPIHVADVVKLIEESAARDRVGSGTCTTRGYVHRG